MGRSVEMLSAPLPDCRCRVRNSSMTHRPTRSMVSYIQIKAVAMCTTGGKPKTGQVNEQEGGGGGGAEEGGISEYLQNAAGGTSKPAVIFTMRIKKQRCEHATVLMTTR